MFNRRELLLGLAGAATAGADDVPLATVDLLIGQHSQPGLVGAVLQGMPPAAMTGVVPSMMRFAESTCSPWLTLRLRPGEACISLREPQRECIILLRNGCEGFVTSWALPVVQHGLIGYNPARELPVLLASGRGGRGEYWYLREGAPLPDSLSEADAVYACFFGEYEERTFKRMQVVVERLSAAMAHEGNFIFNAVIDAAHEPAVLLTVFSR